MTLRFRLFCGVLVLLACGFALQLHRGLQFETDILALLPADDRAPELDSAQRAFSQHIARRVTLLVGAADPEAARTAAMAIAGRLRASAAFANVQFEIGKDWAASAAALLPHRLGLLSDADRQALRQGRIETLRDQALQALYAPAAFGRVVPAAQDLTGLLSRYVLAQSPSAGRASLDRGLLVVRDEKMTWVLIGAETAGSPFAADIQEAVTADLDAAIASTPAVTVLHTGVVLHAADAARRAKSEMSLFGGLSSAAVVLLVWLTFRSLAPMILSVLSLGIGAAAGLLACQWAFGHVHLITLVFGTSLIGVAVDYSLHFFADQFRDRARWTGANGLEAVGKAILIGHLAAALGYATLLIPPFPGLRQMALFSIVGLMFSCASVLCLYPRLARATASRHQPRVLLLARRLSASRIQFRANARHIGGALLLVALTGAGLAQLSFRDDIRLLQSSPDALLQQEREQRSLLGIHPDSRYLLVTGADAETLLQREEALTAVLAGLQQQGALGNWLAVSRALPSLQRQTENRALQREQVLSANGLLPTLMRQLGADDAAIAAARDTAAAEADALTPEQWLADPASAALRPLWLGGSANGLSASAVTLDDVRDPDALMQATRGLPGVYLIDRVGEVSALMSRYREAALGLMGAVCVAIFGLLALRYGWRGGLLCLLPPVGGSVIAMALLGWAGISANLFNVLALLLLIGMGVDYAVFLREGRRTQVTVLLAVGLSALTTLLSFGLLGLSSTPFIRAIGLTLAPGIALIFLLAIWLGPAPESDPC